MLKTLEQILAALELAAASAATLDPALAAPSAIAAYFLKIAQTSVAAHEAIVGEPLDLSKLHEE